MTELRIYEVQRLNLSSLNEYPHLTRLALEDVSLLVGSYFDHFSLPKLEEISLTAVAILMKRQFVSNSITPFLSPRHFPSLRALGVNLVGCYESVAGSSYDRGPLDFSQLNPLECLPFDEQGRQDWIQTCRTQEASSLLNLSPFNLSPPILFDHSLFIPSDNYVFNPSGPALTRIRVRLRVPSEDVSSPSTTRHALDLAKKLLDRSDRLKELYLDVYPAENMRSYRVANGLKPRRELEELAAQKKVDVIWENHSKDWCKSRVSKEFWRRCRERRGKSMDIE